MKRIFILEDDPQRQALFRRAFIGHDVVLVESVEAAHSAFSPPYDVIMLDHDLGGRQMVDSTDESTGYQFCKTLTPEQIGSAIVVIHSYNPEGAQRMLQHLVSAIPNVKALQMPFSQKLLDAVNRFCA